ncbi:Serine/threonine-protein kinase Nek10 [Schistosoma japonicum]|nr:Serine/threonine-protein kinase Nek10 [Schistosoma japonicum]KAH8851788.1 Serine/threonine-protein kinase Nek10 [Schistosoma japonicum]
MGPDKTDKRFKSCLLHVLSKDDEYWKRLSTKRLLIPKLLSLISSEKEYLKLSVLNEISEEDIVEIPELIDYFAFIQPSKQDGIIKTSTSLSMYIMLCLEKLMKISKCQRILRNHNGISILLNQLKGCLQFQSTVNTTNIIMKMSNSSTYNVKTSEECFNEMKLVHDLDEDIVQCNIAICGILSQLAMDDFYAQIITRENGIHLIGSQLLIKYPKNAEKQSTIDESQLKPTSEVNDQQTLNTKHFNTANIRHLYANAFRALRRLFISEHNRRLIKSFLPSTLLSELIEIDIKSTDINDYERLINLLESLHNEEYNELLNGIISCDVNRTPIHYIREYSVLELLGTGAYGKVFKASKNTIPHNNYAIKKVSTSQIFFGRNPNERQKCIDRILNEVNVIRQQLRHPNIVRYYKTFLDSDNLYIVMELLDGVSLTELLASFKEKSIHLVESRIWDIFIQLVLGLRYLHKEKKILHRDLSSNNIMIGEGYKVTITDFGLAHHKTLNSSEIKSTVGTLFYACPEMVQCIPYGEGADIWALGCILYQMCTFTSPFQGECILSTASRIVKGEYESVETKCPNQYSNLIDQVIQVCLKPDPIERPDIIGVAVYLTNDILSQLEATRSKCTNIKVKLKEFKNTFTCHFCCPNKSIQQPKNGEITAKHYTNLNSSKLPDSNVKKISVTQQISSIVTINQKSLREINDPLLDVITVMQKLGHLLQEFSLKTNNINGKYEVIWSIVERFLNNFCILYFTLSTSIVCCWYPTNHTKN